MLSGKEGEGIKKYKERVIGLFLLTLGKMNATFYEGRRGRKERKEQQDRIENSRGDLDD